MNALLSCIIAISTWMLASPFPSSGIPDLPDPKEALDPAEDVKHRSTLPGASFPLGMTGNMPDVLQVTLGGWTMSAPGGDPYTGAWTSGDNVDLMRLDLVFNGVINPPGTLGLGAYGFEPFFFGLSPVYGFVEIDVDEDINTGGECSGATQRYLANVGRFGALPPGPTGERAARSAADYDGHFSTGRQFERSGADFTLAFCGCFPVTVTKRGGSTDMTFDAGDTWIVRGRFLQRAGGYEEASAAYGGSLPQRYDPLVNLRFSHSLATDRTTITLIYPLTMQGAAVLSGQPAQKPDLVVSNHTSIEEALLDVIAGATKPMSTCAQTLTSSWAGRTPDPYLNPSRWRITGIFGASYPVKKSSMYLWTDVAFRQIRGDLDADGRITAADALLHQAELDTLDGSPLDLDGLVNGAVVIANFGPNFNLADLDGNGVINTLDRYPTYSFIMGDHNADCQVNGADLSVLLFNFGSTITGDPQGLTLGGDSNGDDTVDAADLSILLSNFGAACPTP